MDVSRAEDLQQEVRTLSAKLRKTAHKLSAREVQQLTDSVSVSRRALKSVNQRVVLAKAQLGSGALRTLDTLRGDAYIRARINARALRVAIRIAVRAHKFEREKLERNYRRQVMRTSCIHGRTPAPMLTLCAEHKDHVQTRDLVHSREKNLTATVRKYNALVSQIEALLKAKKVPRRGITAPRRLDAKKLFRLDVDDQIWEEDPGLGPQDEGELPQWQVDPDVRRGIRNMLEAQRCREERERLAAEVIALRHWLQEELHVHDAVCNGSEGE